MKVVGTLVVFKTKHGLDDYGRGQRKRKAGGKNRGRAEGILMLLEIQIRKVKSPELVTKGSLMLHTVAV